MTDAKSAIMRTNGHQTMKRTLPPVQAHEPWNTMRLLSLTLVIALASGVGIVRAKEHPKRQAVRTESFDKDPGWEGHNNRIVPDRLPTVTQDFGYSKTNFAGQAAGELGGQVTRASEPAYYADDIGRVTLDDKLSASGTFALTKTSPGGGL